MAGGCGMAHFESDGCDKPGYGSCTREAAHNIKDGTPHKCSACGKEWGP